MQGKMNSTVPELNEAGPFLQHTRAKHHINIRSVKNIKSIAFRNYKVSEIKLHI